MADLNLINAQIDKLQIHLLQIMPELYRTRNIHYTKLTEAISC